MDYLLALSPDLALDPAEFVTTWNAETDTRRVAQARLSPEASSRFDPTLATVAIELLIGVSSGVVSAGIYDFIKKVLTKKGCRNTPRSWR